jgi:hypothetical protein
MAISAVAAKYAPLVILHADDKLRPAPADWFIKRTALRWATGRGLDGVAVPGAERAVVSARLGAASTNLYRYDRYLASALTRPLDDNADRQGDPPLEQGFFLRLRDKISARGAKSASRDRKLYTGTPTYYDYDEEARALTYWLFYPASSPPLGVLRAGEQIGVRSRGVAGQPAAEAPAVVEAAVAAAMLEEFRGAYPGLALEAEPTVRTRGIGLDVLNTLRTVAEGVRALLRDDNVLHEGDWERITVYLDPANPEGAPPAAVAYYRHSTNTFRKWADVKKDTRTHPVVYSAIGSHASLPSADFGFIDVGDPDGPRWRTWARENGVVPITEQPWYGFGGAWGRVGRVRDATGPLGPGAHWKHAAPRPAS